MILQYFHLHVAFNTKSKFLKSWEGVILSYYLLGVTKTEVPIYFLKVPIYFVKVIIVLHCPEWEMQVSKMCCINPFWWALKYDFCKLLLKFYNFNLETLTHVIVLSAYEM